MTTLWLISYVLLWGIVLASGFLLLGTLRSLGRLQWRFDEMEATRPVRKGREGLPPGNRAPDFTLPSTTDEAVALSDFAGHRVLLVFTQTGCSPCHDILPELNRVQEKRQHQVLVVNSGEPEEAAVMADDVDAQFPVLAQDDWDISKQYLVFATPYAFVIDEQGVIAAKGVAGSRQYVSFILEAAKKRRRSEHDTLESDSTVERELVSSPLLKETIHV